MKAETQHSVEAAVSAGMRQGYTSPQSITRIALTALAATPEYQALVKDAERKECFWTSDGDDSPWEGTCGIAWTFIDGGPEENQVAYCPQCGGKLTAQTYDEVESEDAAVDAARNG